MGGGVKVNVSERGRARTEAQGRCDGVGSESSRRKPSQRSMTPGLTGPLRAEGFAVDGRKLLLVKPRAEALGLVNARVRRAVFARHSFLTLLTVRLNLGFSPSAQLSKPEYRRAAQYPKSRGAKPRPV